jgi:hypothetical protein
MLQENKDKKLIELKNNLADQNNFSGKNWLIEKIDERLKTLIK